MNSEVKLQVLISKEEIASAVNKLAVEISHDYIDKNPLLICVLKGSFVFMADLIRYLDIPLEVDFIRLSSYGSGTASSGKVEIDGELSCHIEDRHVLIIEDVVDTGNTTAFLMDYLKQKKPASLKLCALTSKPSRRQVAMDIDYLGFTIPDKFVVGYGLDCDEKYRHLPDICYMETDN